MSYETFTISLKPKALAALEAGLAKILTDLEDSFADDDVIEELRQLECEVRSRMQRVATGDFQVAAPQV